MNTTKPDVSSDIEQNIAQQPNDAARARDNARHNEDRCVLPAGEWLRRMTGLQAPFGHDGLPTVWG